MLRIAKVLEELGHSIEYISCASDPQSLDAIIDNEAKIAIVDGTAPHTLDPNYPGAYETLIHLGDAWDQNYLQKNKQTIIKLNNVISRCHTMATSCITSAATLLDSNRAMAKEYVNLSAIEKSVQQLIDELKDSPPGQERKRLLSAVSVRRMVFFDETLMSLCPKLYVISDDWGAASDTLLSMLRERAVSMKLDVMTCYCSIQNPDKIDHLIFPSAGIGVTTSNYFHATACRDCIPVNGLMKPVEPAEFAAMMNHLSVAQYLIGTAGNHIARAKQLHDELETLYITAMDFTKIDSVYDKIVHDILKEE
jgi:hypothetical protein